MAVGAACVIAATAAAAVIVGYLAYRLAMWLTSPVTTATTDPTLLRMGRTVDVGQNRVDRPRAFGVSEPVPQLVHGGHHSGRISVPMIITLSRPLPLGDAPAR